jgi:hypothetical protein
MRNYVADASITRLNTNALIQAVACVDKNEQPFNLSAPRVHERRGRIG